MRSVSNFFTIPPVIFLILLLVGTSCSGPTVKKDGEVANSAERPMVKSSKPSARIFTYDSLVFLNKRNSIRRELKGRWILDSITLANKRINAKMMIDTFNIQGIEIKYDFSVFASRRMGGGIGNRPIGVYVVDGKEFTLKRDDGTVVDEFHVDESTNEKLVLSQPFRSNRKAYYFSLDMEVEETNRRIFGPNYKK